MSLNLCFPLMAATEGSIDADGRAGLSASAPASTTASTTASTPAPLSGRTKSGVPRSSSLCVLWTLRLCGRRRAGRSRESTGGHLRFVSRRRVSCCVPEVTSGEKRKEIQLDRPTFEAHRLGPAQIKWTCYLCCSKQMQRGCGSDWKSHHVTM